MSTSGKTLAQKWDEWLNSKDGQACADYDTLTQGEYLKNRLWRAFMDGAKAAEDMQP